MHHSMRAEAQSGGPMDVKLQQQVHQVGLSIKRAFLTFMAQLLYDYRRNVLPVGSAEGVLFDSEAPHLIFIHKIGTSTPPAMLQSLSVMHLFYQGA
ncbi:unnamed protein product [Dibothriocephalus latus]|uniref:UDENN domain-containing protein n=1 Tax=Dibothriocephalus latus TaxID=60516 RepID=A0A3P7NC63_DIBLA|nr:unnamed protein product [Dibothriocephalus latus]